MIIVNLYHWDNKNLHYYYYYYNISQQSKECMYKHSLLLTCVCFSGHAQEDRRKLVSWKFFIVYPLYKQVPTSPTFFFLLFTNLTFNLYVDMDNG